MHASPRRRKHFSMDSQLSNLRRHCFRLGDGNRGVRVAMQEEEVRRAAAHVIDRQCIAPDIRLLGLSRAQIADDNLRCRLALGQRWHIQHRVECHNALTRVGCFGLPSLPSYFGSSRAIPSSVASCPPADPPAAAMRFASNPYLTTSARIQRTAPWPHTTARAGRESPPH
jgi:hypothetical protein